MRYINLLFVFLLGLCGCSEESTCGPVGHTLCEGQTLKTCVEPGVYEDTDCGASALECVEEAFSDAICGCGGGQELCGGVCIDTKTSAEHCGSCDSICETPGVCTGGQCCLADESVCQEGSESYCADLESDIRNCGSCGRDCGDGPWQCFNGGTCFCDGTIYNTTCTL